MTNNNSRKRMILGLFFIVLFTLSFFVSCRRETVFFLFWGSDSKTNQADKPQQPQNIVQTPSNKPTEEKELVDALIGLAACEGSSDCSEPLKNLQNRDDAIFLSKTSSNTLCIINKAKIEEKFKSISQTIPIIFIEKISETPQRIQLSVPDTLKIGDQNREITKEVKERSNELINRIKFDELVCVNNEKFLEDMYQIFIMLNNLVYLEYNGNSQEKYKVSLSYTEKDQKFVDFFLEYTNLKKKVEINHINSNNNQLTFIQAIEKKLNENIGNNKKIEKYIIIDKNFIKNQKNVSDFSPIFGLYYLSLNDISNSIKDEIFKQINKSFFLSAENAIMRYYFQDQSQRFVDFLFFANLSYVSHDNKLINETKVKNLMDFLNYTRGRNIKDNFKFINETLTKWKTEKIIPKLFIMEEAKNSVYNSFLDDLSSRLPISENLSIRDKHLFDFTYFYNLSDYSQNGIYNNYLSLKNELERERTVSCNAEIEICNRIRNQKVNYSSILVTLEQIHNKKDIRYLLGGLLALSLFKPDFCEDVVSSSNIIVKMNELAKNIALDNYDTVKDNLNTYFNKNENCTYYVLSYSLLLRQMQIKGDVLYYLEIVPGLAINKLVFDNNLKMDCDAIFAKGVVSKNISFCFNDSPETFLENKIQLTHGKKQVLIDNIDFSKDSSFVKENEYYVNFSKAANCMYIESNLSFEDIGEKLTDVEFKIEFFTKSQVKSKNDLSLKYTIDNTCKCEGIKSKIIPEKGYSLNRVIDKNSFNDFITLTFNYDSILSKGYLKNISYYIGSNLIFSSSVDGNERTMQNCEQVQIKRDGNKLTIDVIKIIQQTNQETNINLNISVPNLLSCELSLDLGKGYSSEKLEKEIQEQPTPQEKQIMDCSKLTLKDVSVLSPVKAYYQDNKWITNQTFELIFDGDITNCKEHIKNISLISLGSEELVVYAFKIDNSNNIEVVSEVSDGTMNPKIEYDQDNKKTKITLNWSNFQVPISVSESFNKGELKFDNVKYRITVNYKKDYNIQSNSNSKEVSFSILKACGIKITKYPQEVFAGDTFEIEFDYVSNTNQKPIIQLLENNNVVNDAIKSEKKVSYSKTTIGDYNYMLKITCDGYSEETSPIKITVKQSCKCLDVSKFNALDFGANQYSIEIPLTNEKNVPESINLTLNQVINLLNAKVEGGNSKPSLKCNKNSFAELKIFNSKITCFYDNKEFILNMTFIENIVNSNNGVKIYLLNKIPYSFSYACECIGGPVSSTSDLKLWNEDLIAEYGKIKPLKDIMDEIINKNFTIFNSNPSENDLSNKISYIKLKDTKFNFTLLKRSDYGETRTRNNVVKREYKIFYYFCLRNETQNNRIYFCLDAPVALNMDNKYTPYDNTIGNYNYNQNGKSYIHNFGKSKNNNIVKIADSTNSIFLGFSFFEILARGQSKNIINFMPLLTFVDLEKYNNKDIINLNKFLLDNLPLSEYEISLEQNYCEQNLGSLNIDYKSTNYRFTIFSYDKKSGTSDKCNGDFNLDFIFYELLDLIKPLSEYSFVISGFEVLASDLQYLRRGVAVIYPASKDKDVQFGPISSLKEYCNEILNSWSKNSLNFRVLTDPVNAIKDKNGLWRINQTFELIFDGDIRNCKDYIESFNLISVLSNNAVVYSFNITKDNTIGGRGLYFKEDGTMNPNIEYDQKNMKTKITLNWSNFQVPISVSESFNNGKSEVKVLYLLNITLTDKNSYVNSVDFNIINPNVPKNVPNECKCIIDCSKLPEVQKYDSPSKETILNLVKKNGKDPTEISINLTMLILSPDDSPKYEYLVLDCKKDSQVSITSNGLTVNCSYSSSQLKLSFSNVKTKLGEITKYHVASIPISVDVSCSWDGSSKFIDKVILFSLESSTFYNTYKRIKDEIYKNISLVLKNKPPKKFSANSLVNAADLKDYFLVFNIKDTLPDTLPLGKLAIFSYISTTLEPNNDPVSLRYYDFCVESDKNANDYFCFDYLKVNLFPFNLILDKLIVGNNMFSNDKLIVPKNYITYNKGVISGVSIGNGVYPIFQIAKNEKNFLPSLLILDISSNKNSIKINIDDFLSNFYLGSKYTMLTNQLKDPRFFTSINGFELSNDLSTFKIRTIYNPSTAITMIEIFTFKNKLSDYLFVVSNYENWNSETDASRIGILVLYPKNKVNQIAVKSNEEKSKKEITMWEKK